MPSGTRILNSSQSGTYSQDRSGPVGPCRIRTRPATAYGFHLGFSLVDCVQQYCYCRERKYCPFDDISDFGHVVKAKENAPEPLRKGLSRAPVEMVATGDYQAAEKKFEVSRRMLEVCLELGFPVSVLERSPLVLRDLDLRLSIGRRISDVFRTFRGRSCAILGQKRTLIAEDSGWSKAARRCCFRGTKPGR